MQPRVGVPRYSGPGPWTLALFELRSAIGRVFQREPPEVGTPRLLNLGCGDTYLDGWVNADFFSLLHFWRRPRSHWSLDLRYPFRCPPDHWDGILTEHVIEHFHPHEAAHVIREMFRTLRPGGLVRVIVPSLPKWIAAYQGASSAVEFARFRGAEVIWSLAQDHGHRSVWDLPLLSGLLEEAGFVDVREVRYLQGTDPRLLRDTEDRDWNSLYVEARKPPRG
jgi:predicted SAM-dependent methyltransferase